MEKKKLFYPLWQTNMIGQLACEIQILRSLFPDDAYDINVIVYPAAHWGNANRSVFDNLTRGITVLESTNPLVVEANHRVRDNPHQMGIHELDDCVWVTLPSEKMVELSISRFGRESWTWHSRLSSQEKTAGLRLEKFLKIPPGRKIVTLHVRNDEPHGPSYYRYRNANINSYLKAINYLLEAGYYVVRLGDGGMTPLPIDSPRLIDAPFNSCYNSFFDLYFIAESEFFIGMLSGPCSIAHCFWTPMLFTNTYYCYGQCGYDKGLMIPKKYYSKQLGRHLTYQEILFSPLPNYNSTTQFSLADIELHENSPEEILSGVIEMEARLSGRYPVVGSIDTAVERVWDSFFKQIQTEKPTGGYNIELMEYVQLSHEFVKLNPGYFGHNWPRISTDVHHAIVSRQECR